MYRFPGSYPLQTSTHLPSPPSTQPQSKGWKWAELDNLFGPFPTLHKAAVGTKTRFPCLSLYGPDSCHTYSPETSSFEAQQARKDKLGACLGCTCELLLSPWA
jgi:hypothetical protein